MVETMFAAPKAIAEMQDKAIDLAFDVADETAKRTEKAIAESVTQSIDLARKQGEAFVDAMNAGEKVRARMAGLVREACHVGKSATTAAK